MNIPIKSPKGGQGWGDGQAARRFHKGRMRKPENTYTGFRPRVANEGAYYTVRNWADDPRINKSFSHIINALLPGLMTAVLSTTEIDTETGEITIELNLGRITI